jgi:hypothetical protein
MLAVACKRRDLCRHTLRPPSLLALKAKRNPKKTALSALQGAGKVPVQGEKTNVQTNTSRAKQGAAARSLYLAQQPAGSFYALELGLRIGRNAPKMIRCVKFQNQKFTRDKHKKATPNTRQMDH